MDEHTTRGPTYALLRVHRGAEERVAAAAATAVGMVAAVAGDDRLAQHAPAPAEGEAAAPLYVRVWWSGMYVCVCVRVRTSEQKSRTLRVLCVVSVPCSRRSG